MEIKVEELKKKDFFKLYWELIVPNFNRAMIIIFLLLVLNFVFICDIIFKADSKIIYSFILNLITLSQTILLTMIAILVTGYALFQALLTKNHAKALCSFNKDSYSYFTRFNTYFYLVGITYITVIFINFVFSLFFSNIELVKFLLISLKPILNEYIVFILLNCYLFVIMALILDFKSFLKNLYENFKVNVYLEVTENEDNN